ncbi:MAG: hypothetical protein HYR56_04735 [Acidobacteria bacterium]|nr:hypothetical protein [Acidobacteriota bacterium]MBI3425445.1 hypothetical protein [Acidobacteriota bacterium]
MKRMIMLLSFVTLSLVLLPASLGQRAAFAQSQTGPLQLEGELNGAPYAIRVPENWNGTLVVYAHIYRIKGDFMGQPENRAANATLTERDGVGVPELETYLLERGYALAGSAFRENGWAVEQGMEDTLALTNFFREQVGVPQRTILMGASMGSLIALEGAEHHPDAYDAALCMCGPTAGATRLGDVLLNFAVAYDMAFGWPEAWGRVGDVRDDLNFETEVMPVLLAQLQDPSNLGRWEFVRLVNHMPLEGFYDSGTLFNLAYYATAGRAEIERRAGGPTGYNLDHNYMLMDPEKAYLSTMGVDADVWLETMNTSCRTYAATGAPRQYLERNFEPDGVLLRPVLTLKSVRDAVAPSNEWVLRETVNAMGKNYNLASAWTDNPSGHCNFSQAQVLTALQTVERWLSNGVSPVEDDFPLEQGFLRGYEPPRPDFPVTIHPRRWYR